MLTKTSNSRRSYFSVYQTTFAKLAFCFKPSSADIIFPRGEFQSLLHRITLQVVIFRSNMTSRLMRHAIREPSETDLAEMSVRTILSQSHLAPFPQRISPIFWGWDHALESVLQDHKNSSFLPRNFVKHEKAFVSTARFTNSCG